METPKFNPLAFDNRVLDLIKRTPRRKMRDLVNTPGLVDMLKLTDKAPRDWDRVVDASLKRLKAKKLIRYAGGKNAGWVAR